MYPSNLPLTVLPWPPVRSNRALLSNLLRVGKSTCLASGIGGPSLQVPHLYNNLLHKSQLCKSLNWMNNMCMMWSKVLKGRVIEMMAWIKVKQSTHLPIRESVVVSTFIFLYTFIWCGARGWRRRWRWRWGASKWRRDICSHRWSSSWW